MPLNKIGSPSRLKVVKYSGFSIDPNYISEIISKQWPTKNITLDDLHSSLKQIGVTDYSSDDLSVLISRLEAIGILVSR